MNYKKSSSAFLFVAGLFLSTLVFSTAIPDPTLIPRYLFLAFFLLLSALWIVFTNQKRALPIDLITVSYAVYLSISLASCSWAVSFSEAVFSATGKIMGGLVFYFTIVLVGQDISQRFLLRKSALGAAICFAATAVVVVYQAWDSAVSEGLFQIVRTDLTGLNSNKNLLSSYIYLLLPFTTMAVLSSTGIRRSLWWVVIFLMISLLFILGTRAVLLAMGCVVIIYLFTGEGLPFFFRKYRLVIRSLIVTGTFLFIFWLTGWKEVGDQGGIWDMKSLKTRSEIWEKSWEMFMDHPLTGVGAGNWKIHFPLYWEQGLEHVDARVTIFQTPHNDLFQTLLEGGILALLFYVGFIFLLIYRTFRQLPGLLPNEQKPVKILLIFALGYGVISFFDFSGQRIEHQILFNYLLALLYIQQSRNGAGKLLKGRSLALALIPAVFLMAFSIYIGVLRYRGAYHNQLMVNYRKQGNLQAVARHATKAGSAFYQLDPASVPMAWYKGNAMAAMGQTREAHKAFLLALQHHPYQITVMGDLATAESLSGNYEKAKELYLRALEIHAGYDDARQNLSIIYLNEGRLEEAIEEMKKMSVGAREQLLAGLVRSEPVAVYSKEVKKVLNRSLPDTEVVDQLRLKLAMAYIRQKNWHEGWYWLKQTRRESVDKIDKMALLVRRFKETGEEELSREILNQLLLLHPRDERTRRFLSEVFLRNNMRSAARALSDRTSHAGAEGTQGEKRDQGENE